MLREWMKWTIFLDYILILEYTTNCLIKESETLGQLSSLTTYSGTLLLLIRLHVTGESQLEDLSIVAPKQNEVCRNLARLFTEVSFWRFYPGLNSCVSSVLFQIRNRRWTAVQFSSVCVCLSVCLSVCPGERSRKLTLIFCRHKIPVSSRFCHLLNRRNDHVVSLGVIQWIFSECVLFLMSQGKKTHSFMHNCCKNVKQLNYVWDLQKRTWHEEVPSQWSQFWGQMKFKSLKNFQNVHKMWF